MMNEKIIKLLYNINIFLGVLIKLIFFFGNFYLNFVQKIEFVLLLY